MAVVLPTESLSADSWLALAALILNVLVAAVGLTWGVGKIRDTVRDEIDAQRVKLDQDMDMIGRSVGETAAALREKIREVELYARDTFMRRESFYKTMEMLSADIRVQFTKMEARLERMETKLDTRN